ncbi:MAG: helix-turn-helix transcriptional regulator [Pseudomonadota bacterium]
MDTVEDIAAPLEADYSNDAATFGDRVVAAREAMALTQKQLARRLGIKVKTLENWEYDRAEPRANKLQMLAGVLNVSMIWLLSGEGPGPAAAASAVGDGETADILEDLRALRSAHADMAARLLRLERRLMALSR